HHPRRGGDAAVSEGAGGRSGSHRRGRCPRRACASTGRGLLRPARSRARAAPRSVGRSALAAVSPAGPRRMTTHAAAEELEALCWPAPRLDEALLLLARFRGRGDLAALPRSPTGDTPFEALERWIGSGTEALGLETESLAVTHADAERLV